MALKACPHMIMRCPHYRAACQDITSKACHHIKCTRMTGIVALSALQSLEIEGLPDELRDRLEETKRLLEDDVLQGR